VREVLETVQRVAGRRLDIRNAPRRAGDPARIVSDPALIRRTFPWQPQYDDLEFIVRSALDWEKKLHTMESVPGE
jgi:UDP-glucose 4-epimerase